MKTVFSLSQTFLSSLILVSFLSIALVGYVWVSHECKKFNKESRMLKEEYIAAQKEMIKNEVERVVDYVKYKRTTTEQKLKKDIKSRVYEAVSLAMHLVEQYRATKSEQEIEEIIKETLRPMRFNGGRGYYFIFDRDETNILHPVFPDLEGKNSWDLQNSKVLSTIRTAIRSIKSQKEGFLEWRWYKPGNVDHLSQKIGFVKYFEPLDWWIGTGDYVEDVEKDIQKETLEWINKIRFGNDGYIFVYTFDAITLAHYKQINIGKNRWDYTDPNGVKVLRELIRLSQNKDGGYLNYVGTIKPSTGKPAAKLGYAKSIPDWEWMIGAGAYVDDIETILAKKRSELTAKIESHCLKIVIILLSLLFITLLIARYISGKTKKNFDVFSSFFKKAATESVKIRDDGLYFSEFKGLALSANRMVEERNKAEEALKELQEQLNRAKKMEALGVLAGGVAHDLNNVLSAIVSYPDLLLLDLPENSPLKHPILTIQKSGLRAAAIVQDLLTLARRGVVQRDVVNLNDIISDYLMSPEHAQLTFDYSVVHIETRLDPDLLNIKGSPVHLKKTVMNLVFNAAEAHPADGKIIVSTENRYVDQPLKGYDLIQEGDFAVLRVEDQGIGIASDDLQRIFEPFYTKKVMGRSGTGLGMAVVWGTVQDHNGYIDVKSTEGEGTTFELYFPVTRGDITGKADQLPFEYYTGKGETVLVVDDVKEQREIAQAMLKKLKYRVAAVSSGEEAVEYIQNKPVDLVVLDMIMVPGIDGLEAYQKIVKTHPFQKAVIVSGFAETERVREAQKLGAGQYIKKPYSMEKLGLAVKAELAQS